ncbi:MAG: tetratricopeptide repeat protein [Clostridium sp.]|nr:tetratricopeptide repeat protein [Clostridium sp.]
MENGDSYNKNLENIKKKMDFLFETDKYELAIEESKKLLEYEPDNFKALYTISSCYYNMEKSEEATNVARGLIEKYPEHWQANDIYARTLFENKEYEKSTKYSRKAIELNPNAAYPYYFLSFALEKIGGKENLYKALKLINKALEMEPSNAGFHANACSVYINIGEYSKAKEEGKKAIELNPEYDDAHLNYGVALLRVGEVDRGMEHFYEALRINPGNPSPKKNIDVAKKIKKSPEAYYKGLEEQYFDNDLKINANSKGFLVLTKIFIDKKRYSDALRIFKKYLKINPNSVEEHIGYANILYNEGAPLEALQYFKELKLKNPNNEEIHKYIKDISEKIKNKKIKVKKKVNWFKIIIAIVMVRVIFDIFKLINAIK